MEGETRDDPSSSSSSSSSEISPWGLLVLFFVFILLFLPSLLSSVRGFRPAAIKSGWDTLNFVLVVFAILCGVLCRRKDESDRSPAASSPKNWFNNYEAAQTSYLDHTARDHAAGTGIRRMRSSSSYPNLRQDAAWGGAAISDGWRWYDDTQLYRRKPESRGGESQCFREWAGKTIPVDTVVPRQISSPRSRSVPPSPPPPPPVPPPAAQPLARTSVHTLPDSVVEKDEISEIGKYGPSPLPQAAQPRRRHRKGKSLETLPEVEVERNTNLGMRHRRSRTVEDLPNWELQQARSLGVQEPHQTPHSTPPPPPPPPPLPSHSKKNHKKRSGSGAKDIAAAIALFYQKKKKWSKTRRSHEDLSIYWEPSSSSSPPPPPPPLPPPPPPSSVSHNLFTHRKSNNRGIQSPSSASPPPPPPPPPSRASSTRRSNEQSSSPIPSHPPRTHRSKKQAPLPPPSQGNLYNKKEKYDLSSIPHPPPSPLPPPPPPSPPPAADSQELFSDTEVVLNTERKTSELTATKVDERGAEEGVPVFCPSPDVNNKADLFIARFRARLELEKQNSIREKNKQQQEEKIMIIGSLFDEDFISN